MHLRVADLVGDLRLGHVLDEAQAQDQPLALVELGQTPRRARVCPSTSSKRSSSSPTHSEAGDSSVLAAGRAVERERPAVVVGLHHLEHFGLLDLEFARRSRRPRASAAARSVSSVVAFSTSAMRSWRPRGTRTVQTRSRKWRFSSPRIVGEAKAVKGVPRLGVEAVDRVDQAEVGDLQQVVEGLAGAAVAQRQAFGEGQVAADQLLADGGVAWSRTKRPRAASRREVLIRPGRAGGGVGVVLVRLAAMALVGASCRSIVAALEPSRGRAAAGTQCRGYRGTSWASGWGVELPHPAVAARGGSCLPPFPCSSPAPLRGASAARRSTSS